MRLNGPIDFGCGTVFKLTPPAPDKTGWQFSAIYAFDGAADGYFPIAGLAIDRSGALYGVAAFGGLSTADCTNAGTCGLVFRLTPPGSGQTAWTKSALYQFTGGLDGAVPAGTPLLAANGRIYGTTLAGGYRDNAACNAKGSPGITGCGVVYELSPPAPGKTAWTDMTLLSLRGNNGNVADGNLTADQAGNLYGAASDGGNQPDCATGTPAYNGCGVAFELSPPTKGSKIWPETILYKFTNAADSSHPWTAPVRAGGAYNMTTSGDEVKNFGSIVALLPPASGQTGWTEKTQFTFSNDENGGKPVTAMLFHLGKFYGTTYGDPYLSTPGAAAYGTIFSYTP
jgi:hypothetical protein